MKSQTYPLPPQIAHGAQCVVSDSAGVQETFLGKLYPQISLEALVLCRAPIACHCCSLITGPADRQKQQIFFLPNMHSGQLIVIQQHLLAPFAPDWREQGGVCNPLTTTVLGAG
ncbi:hypothetical protein XELAEV_18046604mg [Xenopus laevis]|uniref:Uncharacterized protein n=1 Tax=Xenopus laevis TaxID=8355 RepID=A0A974BT93_XENLA|nr:hypothetical protein XELAEV_18046604mg [Xenopus laevis]